MSRLARYAPLTGAMFAILSAATIIITPASPSSSASGATVISFYEAHGSTEQKSVLISMAALVFFMFFAGTLRTHLRTQTSGSLPALSLAGATLFTAGLSLSAGFAFALADVPTKIQAATAQTLNMLDEDVFFTMEIGIAVFTLATGLAILCSGALPKWLGWLAIVIGLFTLVPPLFAVGLIGTSFWSGGVLPAPVIVDV